MKLALQIFGTTMIAAAAGGLTWYALTVQGAHTAAQVVGVILTVGVAGGACWITWKKR